MRRIFDPPAAKRKISSGDAERARQLFLKGVALHEQGRLARAKTCFAEVLGLQPAHAEALHALGVIAAQSGQPKRAIQLARGRSAGICGAATSDGAVLANVRAGVAALLPEVSAAGWPVIFFLKKLNMCGGF